jgi:hypothetical protein
MMGGGMARRFSGEEWMNKDQVAISSLVDCGATFRRAAAGIAGVETEWLTIEWPVG